MITDDTVKDLIKLYLKAAGEVWSKKVIIGAVKEFLKETKKERRK